MELTAGSIAAIAVAATAFVDKLIQIFWPHSKVNSIFDVVVRLVTSIAEGMTDKPRKEARETRLANPADHLAETAQLELFRAGGPTVSERGARLVNEAATEGRVSRAIRNFETANETINPSADAYWGREDIQAWAAANPALAERLRTKHGR